MSKRNTITVTEIFGPTLQGEGSVAGHITSFIRTGGCDFVCEWCLAPTTKINLHDGSKKSIQDIEIGDELLAYDESTHTLSKTKVINKTKLFRDDLVTITAGNTERSNNKVVCSQDHRWYVKDKGWTYAKDLKGGDILLTSHDFSIKSYKMLGDRNPMKNPDNGLTVKHVKPLSNKAKGSFAKYLESGELPVYDLQCEPHPNFFANKMLSHNCDSLHAVLPSYAKSWKKYNPVDLAEEILGITDKTPMLITLSGGNPALQPFHLLFDILKPLGYTFSCETQGTYHPEWFSELDYLVLSPKPPSSKMVTDWDKLDLCIEAAKFGPHVSLKIVVMNEDDYMFARKVANLYPEIDFYISIGNKNPPAAYDNEGSVIRQYGNDNFDSNTITEMTEWLLKRITTDYENWPEFPIILPQIHTLIWGNKAGV